MKKIFIVIVSLATIITIFYFHSNRNNYKYLIGKSYYWKSEVLMTKNGATDITIIPCRDFIFPSNITLYIYISDECINMENLAIRTGNTYNAHYPTIKSEYKNAEKLIFIINYADRSEKIELSKVSKEEW